jgi:folate-dependent phosphoribosylglycinamide formyltransferase PurN
VTGKADHHKNLCALIAEQFEVVGIIHPKERPKTLASALRGALRMPKKYGLTITANYLLGKAISPRRATTRRAEQEDTDADYSTSCDKYARLERRLVREEWNLSSPDGIEMVRSLKPDVTICFGGPVYSNEFIDASPLTLNFHSGISPIYNGAASIFNAFANGHPHLCGGTLMIMSGEIDGGRILGHYLPEVRSCDGARVLFNRTVRGACEMYGRILRHLSAPTTQLVSIAQPGPLFYTRSVDYGIFQDALIARRVRDDIAAQFARPARIVEYWREDSTEAGLRLYERTMGALIWQHGGDGSARGQAHN